MKWAWLAFAVGWAVVAALGGSPFTAFTAALNAAIFGALFGLEDGS